MALPVSGKFSIALKTLLWHKQNHHNELSNILKIFFDFTYYLGVCPFRIVQYNNRNGNEILFKRFTWKPQMILCATLNSLCIIRLISEIRFSNISQGTLPQNPLLYFHMVLTIFAFVYKLSTFTKFWENGDNFLAVLNQIQQDKCIPVVVSSIQNPAFTKSVLCVTVCMAIVDLCVGSYFVEPIWRWSPQWWLRQLVALARYIFFVGDKPKIDQAPELEIFTLGDICLAMVTAIVMFQRYINGLFCDLCILSHVITLWLAANAFGKLVSTRDANDHENVITEETAGKDWSSIYRKYKSVRRLAMAINKALGNLITCFMTEAILFYSIYLDETLTTKDFFKKGKNALFYFNTFSILLVSADICSRMSELETWLSDDRNRKSVPLDDLQIVLKELTCKDIGIKGSNIFTITYPLIASYITLIVTYFIISVQYR